MSEKYKANLDHVLIKLAKKNSSSLGDKDKILFSKTAELNGEYVKFAFDLYRVENDPYQDLWILDDIDGAQHLIRASHPTNEHKTSGDWTVVSNYDKNNITLRYKNIPITSFSSENFGFNKEDIITFKEAILDQVGGDESFIKNVFSGQPSKKVDALVGTFPELVKYV